jgi:hypothetical protein
MNEAEVRCSLGQGHPGEIGRIEIAGLDQPLQADQEWVAGEGGKGAVRRVTVAGGTKGENLPDRLPGSRQKVDEGVCLGPQRTDAVGTGKGRGVQQDAACS